MNNIAGQTAKPERQARSEEKQSPHDDADNAENQKGPSEFAEWVHELSLKLLCFEVKASENGERYASSIGSEYTMMPPSFFIAPR